MNLTIRGQANIPERVCAVGLLRRLMCNRSDQEGGEVAYRMLSSPSGADDAVQEAWLRLSSPDVGGVENLGGWLTTVV
jgi:DNA-directed RNA polymerase specialized sigma24 family protein